MLAEPKGLSQPGFFISLEGIEGTGKSTQASLLAERLSKYGVDVLLTREPGGTVIGNRIRDILLLPDHAEMSAVTELLLYNAARSQLLAEKILPALKKGKTVITDRFSDSTFAYQGYGRSIDMGLISSLDRIATGGLRPDVTLLLDLDIETGLTRNRSANKIDRIELEDIEFHRRVSEGFRELEKKEPDRIKIIDASASIEEITETAWRIVIDEMRKRGLL